jgi:hypothetical protein
MEKYPFKTTDWSLLNMSTYVSRMSTIMLSIVWWTFGFKYNLTKTFFNSPITLTLDLSDYMIWILYFSILAFNFSHTINGITLEEAHESTIQLWKFLLNISKVNKKGGGRFWRFPIKKPLISYCFLAVLFL